MRPVRLELKGFSAFREATELDLSDLELFALVGPTGAGKSSLIDGIVFALYGSVVRYRAANLVAPVINQLSSEARVRLDFVLGEERYTATRIVRRTAKGATTKEARLERGDDVLAGNARELDAAIVELLGLDFDQFTKTVVLPQGEFARFLTETAESRQGLLRRLLGMELYREMGSVARERAKTADMTRSALVEHLHDRAVVSNEMIAGQRARVDELESLDDAVRAAADDVTHATTIAEQANQAFENATTDLARLKAVKVPSAAVKLAERIDRVEADRTVAQVNAEAAARELAEAIEAVAVHRSVVELESIIERLGELKSLRTALTREEKARPRAERARHRSAKALERAETDQAEAERALADTRVRAGLAGVAEFVHVGDDCPVCGQTITSLPSHTPDNDVAAAEARVAELAEVKNEIREEFRSSEREFDRAGIETERLAAQIETIEAQLGDASDEKSAKSELREATTLERTAEKARRNAETALAQLQDLEARLSSLDDENDELRQRLTNERDQLVSLGPPTPQEHSVADDWTEFGEWAAQQRSEAIRRCDDAKAAHKQAATAARAAQKQLDKLFASLTDGTPVDPLRWIATERGTASARLDALLEEHRAQAKTLERIDDLEREGSVAAELGRLLSARGFEQWLMRDVMHDLAVRATDRLFELSGGAYSLVTDGTDFAIRDHRNADEIRGARTLSGGETFLASLALALALSESVSDLASVGAPRIEAMFLDEGFGTLDPDTLDVAASAIEELGAAGRMIGLVTHVSELADRIPTRFDVRKSSAGSTVTRIHD